MVRNILRLGALGLLPLLLGCSSVANTFFGPAFYVPVQEVSVPPETDTRYSQPPPTAKFQRKTRIEKAGQDSLARPAHPGPVMPLSPVGQMGGEYLR